MEQHSGRTAHAVGPAERAGCPFHAKNIRDAKHIRASSPALGVRQRFEGAFSSEADCWFESLKRIRCLRSFLESATGQHFSSNFARQAGLLALELGVAMRT